MGQHKLVVICVVLLLFALFHVLFLCKCILYYCYRVTTRLLLTNISYHIISYHILHHITPHHITSHHTTSHHITSHHTTPHHTTPHHITSHHISFHITFQVTSITNIAMTWRAHFVLVKHELRSNVCSEIIDPRKCLNYF
jgi:hypothetical protein